MKAQKSSYIPVSCDLIDEIEVLSIKKALVRFKVRSESGQVAWVTGKVKDLFVKDHADYMQLEDGSEIRLDHVLEHRVA